MSRERRHFSCWLLWSVAIYVSHTVDRGNVRSVKCNRTQGNAIPPPPIYGLKHSPTQIIKCFGWGKGGKVTSAGWQVTLCDLVCHVISRSVVVISITNCYIRLTYKYGHASQTWVYHSPFDWCSTNIWRVFSLFYVTYMLEHLLC